MIVAIFGASGRTGRQLVDVALAHGDDVRAMVRRLGTRSTPDARERFVLVHGDPRADATIAQSVRGANAVCCVFGPRGAGDTPFCAALTRRIIRAMEEAGVHRVVCVTGAMVGPMSRNTSAPMRIARSLFARMYPALARDLAEQERAVAESDTEWTLVKPPRLTDAPRTGVVHAGPHIAVGLASSIARRDLAEFVHRVATQDRYVRQRVYVRG